MLKNFLLTVRRYSAKVSLLVLLPTFVIIASGITYAQDAERQGSPSPLIEAGHPVNWWFAFKFNAGTFPGCGAKAPTERVCRFGGDVQDYVYSQQFVYATNENPSLKKGGECIGDTVTDPLGATFDQLYNGAYYYVVWNDQFYDDPQIAGCGESCGAPWGHSKGMLAWNQDGDGVVLQVSTPSWPASGSKQFPRKTDGNTLGCVEDDNIKVSQHFFSVKLTKSDVIGVLKGLKNASVVTDINNPQIVRNGGPDDIQQLVSGLGVRSSSTEITRLQLSSGIGLISKPSKKHIPPWQMVSSLLGSVPIKTATWWMRPKIYSTTASTEIACWDNTLNQPGPVTIAMSGQWEGTKIGLKGGAGPNFNHAKIGVSDDASDFAIFGDMNQQGVLSGANCGSSQNGRGGLFYVVQNQELSKSIRSLLDGDVAPTTGP
ncbi:hypothetical protein H8K38_11430 [Undibacterium sp. FT79W]|uniref:deoxyribonuclease II family protein n=1 Tax=Undibacterium sp. FT79W TaxID=2762296 RepID=UPI00164C30BA|nr:deoxyribonuclease II family protein [Undibacterium sp. FT79W]MBC3878425.1 hypothetical protein [Undibacterium sp. FT79W]